MINKKDINSKTEDYSHVNLQSTYYDTHTYIYVNNGVIAVELEAINNN